MQRQNSTAVSFVLQRTPWAHCYIYLTSANALPEHIATFIPPQQEAIKFPLRQKSGSSSCCRNRVCPNVVSCSDGQLYFSASLGLSVVSFTVRPATLSTLTSAVGVLGRQGRTLPSWVSVGPFSGALYQFLTCCALVTSSPHISVDWLWVSTHFAIKTLITPPYLQCCNLCTSTYPTNNIWLTGSCSVCWILCTPCTKCSINRNVICNTNMAEVRTYGVQLNTGGHDVAIQKFGAVRISKTTLPHSGNLYV